VTFPQTFVTSPFFSFAMRDFLCGSEGLCALFGTLHASSVTFGIVSGIIICSVGLTAHSAFLSRDWRTRSRARRGLKLLVLIVSLLYLLTAAGRWVARHRPLPAVCPADTDYLGLQSDHYSQQPCSAKSRQWQHLLTDKVVGAAVARSLGVYSPQIFYLGDLEGLPTKWPESWGRHLVVKPLSSFSSRGVLRLVDGYDRKFDASFAGREDVRALYDDTNSSAAGRNRYWQSKTIGLHARRDQIIVEELLLGLHGGPADDYKFFMFGSQIGGMYTASDRSGAAKRNCLAWYDAQLEQRTDDKCVVNAHSKRHRRFFKQWREAGHARACSASGCDASVIPSVTDEWRLCERNEELPALPPRIKSQLLAAVTKLGGAVGSPFRIDMYVSTKGVSLGEFTCNPLNFKVHCAIPTINGKREPCHLGQLLRSIGGAREAGSQTPMLPVLRAVLRRNSSEITDSGIVRNSKWTRTSMQAGFYSFSWKRDLAVRTRLLRQ
jgi:hypothetical protein